MNQIHNDADDVVTLSNLDAETLPDAVARPDDVNGLGLMTLRAKPSISNSTEEKPFDSANTKIQKQSSDASLNKSNSGASLEISDSPGAPRIRNGFTRIEMQMKSKAEQARRRVAKKNSWRNKMILRPDGRPRIFWDCAILFIITYSSFEIPYTLIFAGAGCEWDSSSVLNFAFDLFFLADIAVNFNTAFVDDFAAIVRDHAAIAAQYFRGWFAFDCASSVPLDRAICATDPGNAAFLRVFKALRLLKMFRVIKGSRVLQRWQASTGSQYVKSAIRALKFCTAIIFATHLCGCTWMLLIQTAACKIGADEATPAFNAACDCAAEGSGQCADWNWLQRFDPVLAEDDSRPGSKYLIAIYFTVITLGTIGYGDVLPTNDTERAYAMVLALAGAIFLSFCVTALSNMALVGNRTDRAIEKSLKNLTHFMGRAGVSNAIAVRAQRELRHTARQAPFLVHPCLSLLSTRTLNEVMDVVTAETVGSVKFFKELDHECRAWFARFLRPCCLHPGEYLFKALELGDGMYWIVSGALDVLDFGDSRTLAVVSSGNLIGEVCIIAELGTPYRLNSVRARTPCSLLCLARHDFDEHLKPHFPTVYKAIAEIAEVRMRLAGPDVIREQHQRYKRLGLSRAAGLKEHKVELEGQLRLVRRGLRRLSAASEVPSVAPSRASVDGSRSPVA
eukprot:CAMPEP_0172214126 /NCGR_PEP_ID=MMETSP1050-20130122/37987_1 /TAXON_ID=233186 /ORGANISM="Cryptomonas curvata, Strain CCAP979/52" /LENGTH=675 /DNA_ID=CAMNT_0012895059 /DNA_START=301 /DNA_END=2325 /DNA_ORIENTATION=-